MKGKKEEILASRLVWPQAHLAKIDKGIEPEDENKLDNNNVLTDEFAAMSFSHTNDITLSSYALSSGASTLNNIPLALASISQSFNSVLDSACTNYIIHD
jgi:hypothetical protein